MQSYRKSFDLTSALRGTQSPIRDVDKELAGLLPAAGEEFQQAVEDWERNAESVADAVISV